MVEWIGRDQFPLQMEFGYQVDNKMEIPFLVERNGGIEIIFITSCDLFIIGLIISCGT